MGARILIRLARKTRTRSPRHRRQTARIRRGLQGCLWGVLAKMTAEALKPLRLRDHHLLGLLVEFGRREIADKTKPVMPPGSELRILLSASSLLPTRCPISAPPASPISLKPEIIPKPNTFPGPANLHPCKATEYRCARMKKSDFALPKQDPGAR